MNPLVSEYIEKAPSSQKAIMELLRKLIHETVAGVAEEYKWSRPVFRTSVDFAYFKTAKGHVTLGFFKADVLREEGQLLEGSGKDMKHVKLKRVEEVDRQLFAEWFRAVSA